jgi:hypothetical protein
MLFDSEELKQHIMLRADAHNLSHFLHLSENVSAKDFCLSRGRPKEPSQHAYSCGLSSAIVAKQHKNLVCKHLKIDPINCLKAIFILLKQVLNPHNLIF